MKVEMQREWGILVKEAPAIRTAKLEFLLWCNGSGRVLGMLGHRFNPRPSTVGKESSIASAAT